MDAKIRFDDNAEFRQQEVFDFRDPSQEDKSEVEAASHNLVSTFLYECYSLSIEYYDSVKEWLSNSYSSILR